jgi:hypothetical protein
MKKIMFNDKYGLTQAVLKTLFLVLLIKYPVKVHGNVIHLYSPIVLNELIT